MPISPTVQSGLEVGQADTGAAQRRQSARQANEPGLRSNQAAIEYLFGPVGERDFGVRYWDAIEEEPPDREPRFTLILRSPGALSRGLFSHILPTQRSLGEAFLRGDLDVSGDLEAATRLTHRITARLRTRFGALGLLALAWTLPHEAGERTAAPVGQPTNRPNGIRHSRRRDAAVIARHYDVGNDFYRLFLDRRMVYSCAYFTGHMDDDDLDTAQEAKLEHICRKLGLREGDRLLDIGCGWGGLIRYAAARYGVRALGITLSEPQAAYARAKSAAAGLTDRCRVQVRDYRNLPRDSRFDKIVSVGMVEHVGRARLPLYCREAYRLLNPGGLFLNHGIVSLDPGRSRVRRALSRPLLRSTSFMERFVFPDGEILTPAELSEAAQTAGFEVRDVENLREHYALTLRHWVRRLESRASEAIALTNETTYRVWRLYMAGSAEAFSAGRFGVIQMLFGKRNDDGSLPLPRTRKHLYASGGRL